MDRLAHEPMDGELWQQASQGDPAAFGVLFERHVDAVYTHCFRRTGSWEAAEDLASVVFLEAWRRRRDVTLSGESILPWLLAVANNVVRNRDRSLRRHRRLLAKLPTSTVAPDPADDAVSRVDDERAMQRVLQVFSRLLPDEQDVLALCVWAGLSYADAAVALGVPVGTVRSRLSRARAHLRRLASVEDSDTDSQGDTPATGGRLRRRSPTNDTRKSTGARRSTSNPAAGHPTAGRAATDNATNGDTTAMPPATSRPAVAGLPGADPTGIGSTQFGLGAWARGIARNGDRRSR